MEKSRDRIGIHQKTENKNNKASMKRGKKDTWNNSKK